MKAYKKFGAALKNANGKPIIRISSGVEDLFIVGNIGIFTECLLLDKKGTQIGFVNMKHLNRLGNANRAKLDPKSGPEFLYGNIFEEKKEVS